MSTPCQLPRTRVQLPPDLSARLEEVADYFGVSVCELAQFALSMVDYELGRKLVAQFDRSVPRPVTRYLRMKATHKGALVLFASDQRVSRSVWLTICLGELVRRYDAGRSKTSTALAS